MGELAIKCPECAHEAAFHSASSVRISRKEHVPFFEKHKSFEVVKPAFGYRLARHFPGLSTPISEENLPDGYKPKNWFKRYPHITDTERDEKGKTYVPGVVKCPNCFCLRKHNLRWPADAYFQIEYKGKYLWAYDRASTVKLLKFVESKERRKRVNAYIPAKTHNIPLYRIDNFLHRIPPHFLTKLARESVAKKLRAKLKPLSKN